MRFEFPAPGESWYSAPDRAAELGVAYLAYSPEAAGWFHPNVTVRSLTAAVGAPLEAIGDRTATFEANSADKVRIINRELSQGVLTQSVEFPIVNPDGGAAHLLHQLQVLVDARVADEEEGQLILYVLSALPAEIGPHIEGFLSMVKNTVFTGDDA